MNKSRLPRCNAIRTERDGARLRCELSDATPRQASHPTPGSISGWPHSEIRNPDGSIVFHLDNVEVPDFWSQVASDVLAQKYFRKAGVAARHEEGRGRDRPLVPVALGAPTTGRSPRCPRAERYVSEHYSKQVFDRLAGCWTYWGWKGGYFTSEEDASRLPRRAALHAGQADGRAELAAVVQHRPALGLRHRRSRPGPLLRRLQDRQADQVEVVLRASAAACLLHPGRRRRPRQRGRHHGPVGARGAPVQIRLRHRLQLLAAARRRRAPVRRRPLVAA